MSYCESCPHQGQPKYTFKSGGQKDLLVIASTDFTHYESPEEVGEKDSQVLEKVKNWDWKGVNRLSSSAC